jgi:TRAP-type C4-dicarboxylate transport system permease small subunit
MGAKLNKLTVILSWVLMALTVIFAILFYFGGVVNGTEGTRFEEPTITNSFIFYAYLLLSVVVLITLFFSIRNLVLNPKGLKLALVAVGIGAILVVIAALLADDTVLNLPHYKGKDNVPRTLLWTDIGLYVAYFLAAIAFIAIIYSEVAKYFKK